MNKKDIIKMCRYFNGNDKCNSTDKDIQMLFKIEHAWVDMMCLIDGDFSCFIDHYIEVGLKDFNETDDVPVSLKAVLFNRFTQYNDCVDVEAFKTWYNKHYK